MGGFFWLNEAIRYIDFDERTLLSECIVIGQATHGILKYEDIRSLQFSEYSFLVNECKTFLEEMYKAGSNG